MKPAPRAHALALALALAAVPAWADPTRLDLAALALRVTVPDGFAPRAVEDASPALLGTWAKPPPRGEGGPVVLQLVRLDVGLEQGELTAAALPLFRGSDLAPFDDRVVFEEALGVEVPALEGSAVVNGRAMVRVAAVLPAEPSAVRVVVVSPRERAAEARADLRAVLASARGRTTWWTPRRLLVARVQRGLAWAAVALAAAYAVGALALWRRVDRWRSGRAAAMALTAALWLAVAAMAPPGAWGAVARSLALAAAFGYHAWRLRAARSTA